MEERETRRVFLDVTNALPRAEEIRRMSHTCAEHGAGEPFDDAMAVLEVAVRNGLSSLRETYSGALSFIESESADERPDALTGA